MAHVLFLQTEAFEHLGLLSLAAGARGRGHRVSLLIGRDPRRIGPAALDLAPDVIALTATTGVHRAALGLARAIRPYYRGLIVLGGPHATFFPEVIADPALDGIHRGEGEAALAELLDRLDLQADRDDIPGFWWKRDGQVIENPPGELIADLDSLPFPARDLLAAADPMFARSGMRRIMAGRGCPYQCTYCFNRGLRELLAGKGPYLRLRGVDNVMAELRMLRDQGAHTVNFVDDCFGLKSGWTLELLARYQAEIGLPFIVNLRPEQADAGMVDALRDAGCYCVQMGVESGRDWVRRELLGRELSDETMAAAARRVKAAGIKLLTYNMVGLPGERLADAAATLDWNARERVDFPRISIFQPYPRTALGDKVLAGLAPGDASLDPDLVSESYFRTSPLAGPDARRIENLHKLFWPYLRWPRLRPLVLALTRLPRNPLYDLVFLLTLGLQYRAATNRTWMETIRLGLRNLRAYFT
jgi:anaerobic magnesium-protoporphyrin IX monomethyl ester cyclase